MLPKAMGTILKARPMPDSWIAAIEPCFFDTDVYLHNVYWLPNCIIFPLICVYIVFFVVMFDFFNTLNPHLNAFFPLRVVGMQKSITSDLVTYQWYRVLHSSLTPAWKHCMYVKSNPFLHVKRRRPTTEYHIPYTARVAGGCFFPLLSLKYFTNDEIGRVQVMNFVFVNCGN